MNQKQIKFTINLLAIVTFVILVLVDYVIFALISWESDIEKWGIISKCFSGILLFVIANIVYHAYQETIQKHINE